LHINGRQLLTAFNTEEFRPPVGIVNRSQRESCCRKKLDKTIKEGGRVVAQTMYRHVSKYKNDKIKKILKRELRKAQTKQTAKLL
jgi:hypothetical protein